MKPKHSNKSEEDFYRAYDKEPVLGIDPRFYITRGNPPRNEHAIWKPGQSGNPKGRPKGALGKKTLEKRFKLFIEYAIFRDFNTDRALEKLLFPPEPKPKDRKPKEKPSLKQCADLVTVGFTEGDFSFLDSPALTSVNALYSGCETEGLLKTKKTA